jgi:cation transport ATPase
MLFLPVVIAGTVLYAGGKAFLLVKLPDRLNRSKKKSVSPAMKKTEQTLAIASASLSLATSGVLLRAPLLGIISAPMMLYVFAPIFKAAWHKLGKEHRINDQVLAATRVTVCVAMGYTFIASLDAVLHAFSHRQFVRNEEEFQRVLREACSTTSQLPDQFHAVLEQAASSPSHMQQIGERHGEHMAPWMFAAFVLTVPLMGVNRAAAFLTTTFGAHLRNLGPYAGQRLGQQAIQQGILITQTGALERAMQIDTLIFDGRIFNDPVPRSQIREVMHALRQRYSQDLTPSSNPLALYILINTDEDALGQALVTEWGLDGCFNASTGQGGADLIGKLQSDGRKVCYVGSGEDAAAEMQTALLPVACYNRDGANTAYAHIILLGNSLHQLPRVFDLAAAFTSKQNFNLIVPIGVDLVDISTTLLLDFGLIYSVMFTYTGLLMGMANIHRSENASKSQETTLTTVPAVFPATVGIVE